MNGGEFYSNFDEIAKQKYFAENNNFQLFCYLNIEILLINLLFEVKFTSCYARSHLYARRIFLIKTWHNSMFRHLQTDFKFLLASISLSTNLFKLKLSLISHKLISSFERNDVHPSKQLNKLSIDMICPINNAKKLLSWLLDNEIILRLYASHLLCFYWA